MDLSFENSLKPFFWVDGTETYSVCLNVGEYLADVFEERADEGFEGNGYDWAALAKVFLDEKMPDLARFIQFDPEGSMFCVWAMELDPLREFAAGFKAACEDRELIRDLFSRAELD
jgi:hypothetical protein